MEIQYCVNEFNISQDSMYIVYTEFSQKEKAWYAYVGKLTDHGIVNKKPIYRNIIPFNIKWSLDNKKILIEAYDYNKYMDIKYMNIDYKDKKRIMDDEKYIIIVEFNDKQSGLLETK